MVPTDKPDTRGDAAQAEDLTERAKKSSVENQQPPVLEHMKKGPASIPAENALDGSSLAGEYSKILIESRRACSRRPCWPPRRCPCRHRQ